MPIVWRSRTHVAAAAAAVVNHELTLTNVRLMRELMDAQRQLKNLHNDKSYLQDQLRLTEARAAALQSSIDTLQVGPLGSCHRATIAVNDAMRQSCNALLSELVRHLLRKAQVSLVGLEVDSIRAIFGTRANHRPKPPGQYRSHKKPIHRTTRSHQRGAQSCHISTSSSSRRARGAWRATPTRRDHKRRSNGTSSRASHCHARARCHAASEPPPSPCVRATGELQGAVAGA